MEKVQAAIVGSGYGGSICAARLGQAGVETVVLERGRACPLGSVDLMCFAVELAKLAHYSSTVAGVALGYPGANPGWVTDPDFTFNRPMAHEITADGNYP